MKFVSIVLILFQFTNAQNPEVCLQDTKICYKGSWLQTDSGQEYASFQGIKYAQAPIGQFSHYCL